MTSSQDIDTFVPVYDALPDEWEDSKKALIERLRRIADNINVREVGFYLEEQQLTGSKFQGPDGDPNTLRSMFRKVVDASPLDLGANSFAHGINFDSSFTLLKMQVAATDSTGLTAVIIPDEDVALDATNVTITSPADFDRACVIIEYILEV